MQFVCSLTLEPSIQVINSVDRNHPTWCFVASTMELRSRRPWACSWVTSSRDLLCDNVWLDPPLKGCSFTNKASQKAGQQTDKPVISRAPPLIRMFLSYIIDISLKIFSHWRSVYSISCESLKLIFLFETINMQGYRKHIQYIEIKSLE